MGMARADFRRSRGIRARLVRLRERLEVGRGSLELPSPVRSAGAVKKSVTAAGEET